MTENTPTVFYIGERIKVPTRLLTETLVIKYGYTEEFVKEKQIKEKLESEAIFYPYHWVCWMKKQNSRLEFQWQ